MKVELFEIHERAVQFVQDGKALPEDVAKVVAYAFGYAGIPLKSAQALAEEIVSTNQRERVEADEPHPLLQEE